MNYKCINYENGIELGVSSVMPVNAGEEHYFGDDLYSFKYSVNNVAFFEEKKRIGKSLDVQNIEDAMKKVSDIKVVGDGDTFKVLCKASSDSQGWMKSTKVCNLPNGCLVQVSTQQRNLDGSYAVAEALTFVPDVNMDESKSFNGIDTNEDNSPVTYNSIHISSSNPVDLTEIIKGLSSKL